MREKPTADQTLGLHFESNILRGAQLSVKQGTPFLQGVFEIKIGLSDDVKPLYTAEEQNTLQYLQDSSLVATAIDSDKVLIRPLTLKLKKDRDIEEVLSFQAEPLLPYPGENAVIDWLKLVSHDEETDVNVVAVRKDHLSEHLYLYQSLKIEPEVVSCVPTALASFSKAFASEEEPIFVVNIGETNSTCALIKNGKLLGNHICRKGFQKLIEAFAKDQNRPIETIENEFSSLDFNTIETKKTPELAKAFEELHLSITKTLYALSKQASAAESKTLMITGAVGDFKKFIQAITNKLEKEPYLPEGNNLFNLTSSQLQKYAIPIGLALSVQTKQANLINFRQEEFSYPYPWKRLKKPLMTYLSGCFLLALAFYLFGNAYIKDRETSLKQDYIDLLIAMEKPYNEVEINFGEQQLPLQQLSQEDILERVIFLRKEQKAAPTSFALFPNTPRVSDVLAWLRTHPQVIGDDGSPHLSLETFSYKMVKRPDKNKKKEKYRVKVELEFSTDIPRYAREFHDALIAPNKMVDPKEEVKWTTSRGNYRTSFFLKDKTVYP